MQVELLNGDIQDNVRQFFPESSDNSVIDVVRIACHYHELEAVLAGLFIFKENGLHCRI